MSILQLLAVTGIALGWLPTGASASTIGTRSRLTARQLNEFGPPGLLFTPLEQALFGLGIPFTILTLAQMGCTFLMLVVRRRQSDYRGRKPFTGMMFFSLLWLSISFVIADIINTQIDVITLPLSISVNFAGGFAELVSPITMYAGLIFLLFQCDAVEAFSGAPRGARITGEVTRIAASVLLFIMLATAIIYEAMASYAANTLNSSLLNAANGAFYLYLAVYEVLTALIVAVSVLLWKKRDPQNSSQTLNRFDSNVIAPILLIICPLLVIRALFEFAAEIAVARPSSASRINLVGVALATVVVEGTTQFLIFTTALFLRFPLGLTGGWY